MLWGCVVSEGKPYALSKDSQYELLHISNAALSRSSEPGKCYLLITKGKETFTLAVLQKDKVESFGLDIYVRASQGITLTVSGKGEVNVTGYFEPGEEVDQEEDAFLEGALYKDSDEDEEDEEEELPKKQIQKKTEQMKPEQKKPEHKK